MIPTDRPATWSTACLETVFIVLLFAAFAGVQPPAVNETHYLTKARHFWRPSWCAGDMFLESADAHLWFFATLGWLAAVLPLPWAAWTGRLLCWTFLAIAWRRLIGVAAPGRYTAVVSAGWMLGLVHYGNMAGEWVVGGFEAKCVAFPLVILAIRNMLLGRWSWVWPQLGLAVMFHVLVGGWALLALLCVRLSAFLRGASIDRSEWWGALLGAAATAAGIGPALALTFDAPASVRQEASWIYTYQRLGHHLVFHRFDHGEVLCHALIWIAAAGGWMAPRRDPQPRRLSLDRLAAAVLFSGVLVLGGIALDQCLLGSPRLAAPWLRYYFFRLADVLAPWWLCCLATQWWAEAVRRNSPRWRRNAWIIAVLLALAAPAVQIGQRLRRPPSTVQYHGVAAAAEQVREQQWRQTCRWIREQTAPTARFLTPAHQRSFKWFAQRPEVWTWKDIPQDAAGIVAWWLIRGEVTWAMAEGDAARLLRALDHYQAGYYVWDRGAYPRPGPHPRLQDVYTAGGPDGDAWFTVFRVAAARPPAD